MRRRAKLLDQSLMGDRIVDAEVSGLVETAREVEEHLAIDVPDSPRGRALFVHAVAARAPRRRGLLVPAIAAMAAAIFVLGYAAGNALPGDRIYSVRKAMESVGLVSSASEQARSLMREANARLTDAESFVSRAPQRARALAFQAVSLLERASRFIDEIPGSERARYENTADTLGDRAAAVISSVEALDDRNGDSSGPGSGDDADDANDSSGPGSDDDADDSDDDSSGPGSGDDADDADDSDDSDDSSGPGSDDDADDNSGSGSSDDD